MLRIPVIEKDKNKKTKNLKALNIGKMILRIVKLKIWLIVILLMEVRYLLKNYLKSTISNYMGFLF